MATATHLSSYQQQTASQPLIVDNDADTRDRRKIVITGIALVCIWLGSATAFLTASGVLEKKEGGSPLVSGLAIAGVVILCAPPQDVPSFQNPKLIG